MFKSITNYIENIKISNILFWFMVLQLFSTLFHGLIDNPMFTLEHEDTITNMYIIGYLISLTIEKNKTTIITLSDALKGDKDA